MTSYIAQAGENGPFSRARQIQGYEGSGKASWRRRLGAGHGKLQGEELLGPRDHQDPGFSWTLSLRWRGGLRPWNHQA